MITHENLVQVVYEDSHDWSCDGYRTCDVDMDCMSCCDNKVTEYENAIRADERKSVLEDACGILADEIWNKAKTHDDRMHNHCVRRCIALLEQMKGEQE